METERKENSTQATPPRPGRAAWDVAHVLDVRLNRRHLWVGFALSVSFYCGIVGKEVFDFWFNVDRWRRIMELQVVDLPWGGGARIGDLGGSPMPLPTGWAAPASPKTARKHPRRAAKPKHAPAKPPEAPVTETTVRGRIEELQDGVSRLKTFNVAPIKEMFGRLLKRQQEGSINTIGIRLSVNFKIRPGCTITDGQILESSRIPEVDEAALAILKELEKICDLVGFSPSESVTVTVDSGEPVRLEIVFHALSPGDAAEETDRLNGLLSAAWVYAALQNQEKISRILAQVSVRCDGAVILFSGSLTHGEVDKFIRKHASVQASQ